MHLTRIIFRLIGVSMTVALFGCGGSGICIDVVPNFSLNDIAYDAGAGELALAGSQSLSLCTEDLDDAERYASLLLTLDLSDLGEQIQIERVKKISDPGWAPSRKRIFEGEFASSCTSCTLVIPFAEARYTLEFIGNGSSNDPMTMTLRDGDTPIASYAFRMLEITRLGS